MYQPDQFKKNFTEAFSNYFDSNFSKIEKYIDYDIKLFKELEPTFIQQYKCLITESFIASITLTNHILERLLKLALIQNYVGLKPAKDMQTFATMYEVPHKLYSDKHLAHTIDHCKKEGLITQTQRDFLFDYIRETIRNGFSHSDTDKVFKAAPDESIVYHQNLTEPINPQPMAMNLKLIPGIQSINLFDFAKDAAPKYFDYVFELMKSIEKELLKRNK
jgi:hypothetical protein